jgi:hypothetical protein
MFRYKRKWDDPNVIVLRVSEPMNIKELVEGKSIEYKQGLCAYSNIWFLFLRIGSLWIFFFLLSFSFYLLSVSFFFYFLLFIFFYIRDMHCYYALLLCIVHCFSFFLLFLCFLHSRYALLFFLLRVNWWLGKGYYQVMKKENVTSQKKIIVVDPEAKTMLTGDEVWFLVLLSCCFSVQFLIQY